MPVMVVVVVQDQIAPTTIHERKKRFHNTIPVGIGGYPEMVGTMRLFRLIVFDLLNNSSSVVQKCDCSILADSQMSHQSESNFLFLILRI